MCLTLYLGTHGEQHDLESSPLTVERVRSEVEQVRQWFSTPHVCFVGAHTGCSCGFPKVVAEEPFDHYEGMFDHSPEREQDVQSLRALLTLLAAHVSSGGVELYPVWNGEEALPPKGRIRRSLTSLTPETFFFIERFMYELTPE
jgi:hypothetical protein